MTSNGKYPFRGFPHLLKNPYQRGRPTEKILPRHRGAGRNNCCKYNMNNDIITEQGHGSAVNTFGFAISFADFQRCDQSVFNIPIVYYQQNVSLYIITKYYDSLDFDLCYLVELILIMLRYFDIKSKTPNKHVLVILPICQTHNIFASRRNFRLKLLVGAQVLI